MTQHERGETAGADDDHEVVSIDVSLRMRAPDSPDERVVTSTYDLTKGDVPPDLRPYQRKPRVHTSEISSAETLEILSVETSPLGVTPLDETSDILMRGGRGTVAGAPSPAPHQEPPEHPILPAGTTLGTFEIIEALGQGGMGVVYKAHDSSLDRYVALKVLSPTLSRNKTFIERFRREAKACGKLSHPNITHIYSISSQDDAYHYFAMEYVEGQNLAERVKREGPFSWEEALEIGRQAARGLKEAAAAKIIHRDIKPSNLLQTKDGRVKITDFGLAKARASMGHTLDLTSTGVVMGTPLYMSPEQGRGGTVDHRSDIYSLGASLYFLTFGTPPFVADTPIALILKHINDPVVFPEATQVPGGVRSLLRRMLEKDLSRRVGTYDDLLDRIDRVLRGEALEEESGKRVIVLPRRRRNTRKAKSGVFKTSSGDGLKASKLSVARTNIKLGRLDKAVSLLNETIKEGDPGLRSEAALLLLSIHESNDDRAGVRRMAETIVDQGQDPAQVAYARWKLAVLDEQDAIARKRGALARYRAILQDPPQGLPREVIEEQVRRLEAQISDEEREGGNTQVILGGGKG